jgi:TatD DNase family protein
VIQNALQQNIGIITSVISPNTLKVARAIAEEHEHVYLSVGLDPTRYEHAQDILQWIDGNLDLLVSIGETGLDHYIIRDHALRDLQEEAFRLMIERAMRLDFPVQVHSRSAGRKALDVLADMNAEKVHMHAFDGKASLARTASRDLGYYFSIPTSVVRSPQKRKLVKAVHIEKLLLETDSPVLGPEKGVRNEPTNIWIALRETAEILRMEQEELRQQVLENTLRLYSRIRSK